MSKMFNIKFELEGLEEALAALDAGNEKALAAAEVGMQEVTADLLRTSVALAPLDAGDLMSTGAEEVIRTGSRVEGEVSFNTPYALRRHEEAPRPGVHPKYKNGHRIDNYYVDGRGLLTRGKPNVDGMEPGRKYLERPLKRNSKRYFAHIANKVKEALE